MTDTEQRYNTTDNATLDASATHGVVDSSSGSTLAVTPDADTASVIADALNRSTQGQ